MCFKNLFSHLILKIIELTLSVVKSWITFVCFIQTICLFRFFIWITSFDLAFVNIYEDPFLLLLCVVILVELPLSYCVSFCTHCTCCTWFTISTFSCIFIMISKSGFAILSIESVIFKCRLFQSRNRLPTKVISFLLRIHWQTFFVFLHGNRIPTIQVMLTFFS